MTDLFIVGAGGFARETIDVVRALGDRTDWRLAGVVDDAPTETNLALLRTMGVDFVGAVSALPDGAAVVMAVGSPATRRALVERVGPDRPFPSLIHPSVVLGSGFVHGQGLVVLGGVCVGSNVSLGDHVHLNAHAVIGHDARLSDFVSVNPQATISGTVSIGRETLVGAAAVVLQGLAVAEGTTVGAAACVTKDVIEPGVLVGVPARPLNT